MTMPLEMREAPADARAHPVRALRREAACRRPGALPPAHRRARRPGDVPQARQAPALARAQPVRALPGEAPRLGPWDRAKYAAGKAAGKLYGGGELGEGVQPGRDAAQRHHGEPVAVVYGAAYRFVDAGCMATERRHPCSPYIRTSLSPAPEAPSFPSLSKRPADHRDPSGNRQSRTPTPPDNKLSAQRIGWLRTPAGPLGHEAPTSGG